MSSTETARTLRRSITEAEAVLWEALRARRLDGRKFCRQHPIGGFVADFCCLRAKLIVEVDGDIHRGRIDADAERDARLRRLGYHVVRVTNQDVIADLDATVERIRQALRELASPSAAATPSPLRTDGEGARG